ncbi:hypothetical protein ACFL3S_05650 [Gemmatimonadota bacterium]
MTDRLVYALDLRALTRHGVFKKVEKENQRRSVQGLSKLPNVNPRDFYAFFSETLRKVPPVPTLDAIARALRVRSAWIAFEDGPMESDVVADGYRELYLVDGALDRFSPPDSPEERDWIRKKFEEGFRNPEGFDTLPYTLRVVFMNVLARVCERQSLRGDPNVQSPFWRGELAADIFSEAIQVAQAEKTLSPTRSTMDAMLRALSDMEQASRF